MKLSVRVLTPDGIMFDRSDVNEVIIPTNTGQIGILYNHAPLLTGIVIGVLRMRIEKNWSSFIALGGTASVSENKIQIMVTTIEKIPNISIQEATESLELCRKNLENSKTKREKLSAEQNYQKAYARVQALALKT